MGVVLLPSQGVYYTLDVEGDDLLSGPVIAPGPGANSLASSAVLDDVLQTIGGVPLIFPGPDGVFQTSLASPDVYTYVITVGPDGVCNSPANGPAVQVIQVGQSAPATCSQMAAVNRYSSVVASSGGIAPKIQITPTLAYCEPGTPASDIVISFQNSGPDVSATAHFFPCGDDRAPGSALKKLHQITFSMKQDVFLNSGGIGGAFPQSSIWFEGSGGIPLTIAAVNSSCPNFYSYNQATHMVTLNFDVLTSQVLGAGGPLVSGRLPGDNNNYRELPDGATVSLRFQAAQFDCFSALFYPTSDFPTGFKFGDYPKPGMGYLFFGTDTNDRIRFTYDDMCGKQFGEGIYQTHAEADYGNLHNNFPETVAAEAGRIPDGSLDLNAGDSALLDFQYV